MQELKIPVLSSRHLTALRTQHYLSNSIPLSRVVLPTFISKSYYPSTVYLHYKLIVNLQINPNDPSKLQACLDKTCHEFSQYSNDNWYGNSISSNPIPSTQIAIFIFNINSLPQNTRSIYDLLPSFLPKSNIYTPSNYKSSIVTTSTTGNNNNNIVDADSIYDKTWPTIEQVSSNLKKNIILCFGTVNQLNGYDPQQDADYIFSNTSPLCASSIVQSLTTRNASKIFLVGQSIDNKATCGQPAAGIQMVGTGFDKSAADISPGSQSNSSASVTKLSWAFASIHEDIDDYFGNTSLKNTLSCGFSPVFVSNKDMFEIVPPLIWSWRDDFPTNETRKNCAVMNKQDGRWTNVDCQSEYPVSCQNTQNPLEWRIISNNTVIYNEAEPVCSPPFAFAAPKTPLENLALFQVMQSQNKDIVWINLNQQLRQFCWLVGLTTACPYSATVDVVPAIIRSNLRSGIILLVIIGIFLYFKINRQIKDYKANKRRAQVRRKIRLLDVNGVAQ